MTAASRTFIALLVALSLTGCEAMKKTAGTVAQNAPGDIGKGARAAEKGLEAAGKTKEAFSDMEEAQEIELGRAVSAAIGKQHRVLRDRDLTRYVAFVGNAVAAQSERPDLKYYFAVLDAPEVNAFAAPGGFIFVTKGALGLMKDEATLAGVLGHEVAHIARRHSLEAMKQEKRKELALFLGQTAVEVAGPPTMKTFAGPLSALADGVAELVLKGYSRADESEADRLGFGYAAAAGYDPSGLRDFLSGLIDRGARDSVIGKFLSTHPGTEERLKVQDDLLKSRAAGGRRNPERFARAVMTRLAGAPTPAPAAPRPAATPAPSQAVAPAAPAARPSPSPAPAAQPAPPRVVAIPVPPQPAPPRPTSEFVRALQSTGRYVSYEIQFASNSDRLSPQSTAALKMIAEAMLAESSLRVHIEGHTDSVGIPARNVELSRRRAEAVKAALVSQFKVPADRLTTSGVGSARPLDTNDTEMGRKANRRVEFVRQ